MQQDEIRETHRLEGMNPVVAIGAAISVAIAMVMVTFVIFINSDAYQTVKQIQIGTTFAQSLKNSEYDTKSPIKADDITEYQKSVDQRLGTFDDTADFNPTDLSEQSLGLTAN